jgi:nucleotidyltransferase-like protein
VSDPLEKRKAISRIREIIPRLDKALGGRGWSLYALGSLAYGNYVPGWSDIDLDVLLSRPQRLCRGDHEQLAAQLTALAHDLGHQDIDVKCFGVGELNQPEKSILYGIANRVVMLLDSAVHLHGPDVRSLVTRPSLAVLQVETQRVASALVEMGDAWWESRPLDDLAALLALPARLLHTTCTGEVIDKRRALESFLADRQIGISPEAWAWCNWALACRFSPAVRELPASAGPSARAAAYEVLGWVSVRLKATS